MGELVDVFRDLFSPTNKLGWQWKTP